MKMQYPFTEDEFNAAVKAWGCNCGPSALAFALQVKLDVVRPAIPDFERKRYTSPTMMKAALAQLGRAFEPVQPQIENICGSQAALVRVQWSGPWTAPGSNPRWAYGYTHWITTWRDGAFPAVFDCNGGVRSMDSWEQEIAPLLTMMHKRADGGWFATHIWRLA